MTPAPFWTPKLLGLFVPVAVSGSGHSAFAVPMSGVRCTVPVPAWVLQYLRAGLLMVWSVDFEPVVARFASAIEAQCFQCLPGL